MKILARIKAVLNAADAFSIKQCEIIRMDEVEATQHSINMAAAPAMVALFLGFAGLIFPEVFPIAFAAIEEFMQFVGIKIAFYGALLLGGFAIIFGLTPFPRIAERFAWLTSSLSFVGFNLAATAFGIVAGLSIPAAVEQRSFLTLGGFLFLSTIFIMLQVLFFCLAHVVEGKYVEPRNKILGKNVTMGGAVIGLALVALALWSGVHEKWPTAQKDVCKPCVECRANEA